jgi:uncharacterized protein (TIGR04255 family)
MARPLDLPNFEQPPVVEVALAVMFEEVNLRSAQVGLLWQERFRDRFPNTEDRPLVALPLERERDRIAIGLTPPFEFLALPKILTWLVNPTGTEFLQVQHNRFAHNWRRASPTEEYPHYEAIREPFETELKTFDRFMQDNGLGPLKPTQCEVTYVNHILASSGGWESHGDLHKVFLLAASPSTKFLPRAEDGGVRVRYSMRDERGAFFGRLHVTVQPAFLNEDPIFIANLTARGRVAEAGDSLDDALKFLDIGREWVVRAFSELTTSSMHAVWRRRQ